MFHYKGTVPFSPLDTRANGFFIQRRVGRRALKRG